MKGLALILALAAPLACGHARQVAQAENPEPSANPPHDKGTVAPDPRAPAPSISSPRRERRRDGKDAADAPTTEDRPPLVTSPTGLLRPDAVKRIQERLHAQGFLPEQARSGKLDEATRKALRELQEKHNLPATGAPDDLTLEKLGLDPTQLTRSAQTNGCGSVRRSWRPISPRTFQARAPVPCPVLLQTRASRRDRPVGARRAGQAPSRQRPA